MSNQEELKTELENIRDSIQALKQGYEEEVRVAEIQLKHDRGYKSLSRFIPLQVERLEVYKRVVKDFEELLR